ncbi:Transposase IS4 [Popillia japonica]|uniref:Transposase IS4 n=1 Tax=Popillia japonica TaxID=7064 RepID=A0AAW1JD95_POPJA
MKRGSYESAFDNGSKISLVRYNDNAVVTMCSNNFSVQPVNTAKRYNRKEKKDITISQPNVITQYNKYMGGVDLHDNGIANYRCRVLGKKWWWPIFCNAVDSTIVNAWKIYNMVNRTKMSLLILSRILPCLY